MNLGPPRLTGGRGRDNLPKLLAIGRGDQRVKWLANIWVRITLSLGLLIALVALTVDLDEAAAALARASWGWLGLLALWLTADRLLMAYKWRLLAVCRGLAITPWQSIKAYYLASLVGSFLPVTLGADALRVAVLAGPGRRSEVLAASVVVERALGFVASALAALAGLALLLYIAEGVPGKVLWIIMGLLTAGALAVILSLSALAQRLTQRLQSRASGKGRLAAWLGNFLEAYSAYGHHRPTLLWFTLLSLIEQSAPVGAAWLAARALEIELSLAQAAAAVPVAILLARAPVSLSGFGVVEGLFVAFFGLVGVGATHAFLLGFISNLASLATAAPGVWFHRSPPRDPATGTPPNGPGT